MRRTPPTILVLDGDRISAAATVEMLRHHGANACAATLGSAVADEVVLGRVDAVVLTAMPPDMSVGALLRDIRSLDNMNALIAMLPPHALAGEGIEQDCRTRIVPWQLGPRQLFELLRICSPRAKRWINSAFSIRRALILHSDSTVRVLLQCLKKDEGVSYDLVCDPLRAIALAQIQRHDVMPIGEDYPDLPGWWVINESRARDQFTPIPFVSSGCERPRSWARYAGANDVIDLPLEHKGAGARVVNAIAQGRCAA